jgi:ABC-type multidrug transport system fused ATPase/permease subunit
LLCSLLLCLQSWGCRRWGTFYPRRHSTNLDPCVYQVVPLWGTFQASKRALKSMKAKAIDVVPLVDNLSVSGLSPSTNLSGDIEYKDIIFSYPKRENTPILKAFNLTIKAGEVVAFCGPSGCGKNMHLCTCIHM